MEETVEDGAGGGDVLEELAPVFEGTVTGHDGGAGLVASHDDFEEVLAGVLGQLLEAHVVDDEQIGLEVAAQEAVTLGERRSGKAIVTAGLEEGQELVLTPDAAWKPGMRVRRAAAAP